MADRLTVGGLFSGIGGWELGLERAGMEIAWHCEADPFCRRVLAKHWPDVPCYEDVCALTGADVSPVDVLCGGFPCQDISLAGKGAGIDGSRSGLWSEFARLVGELRPRYVCVENVSALLGRGLDRVLADLSALGFDAEWDCIPASAVGAPHRRDRVWIVAYPQRNGDRAEVVRGEVDGPHPGGPSGGPGGSSCGSRTGATADPYRTGPQGRSLPFRERSEESWAGDRGPLANSDEIRRQRAGATRNGWAGPEDGGSRIGAFDQGRPTDNAVRERYGAPDGTLCPGRHGAVNADWWAVEPDVGRVANGVPARVDRLRSLGNALVPQIAQWIGERIVSYEATSLALDV